MKTISVYPLPPSLVALLEEKKRNDGRLGPQGTKTWTKLMPSLIKTFMNVRAMASHQSLEDIAIDVGSRLDRLQKTVQKAEAFDDFTADCFGLYSRLNDYVQVRTSLAVTRVPALDALFHAVQAHLRGSLPEPTLVIFEQGARASIDELLALYKDVAPTLEEQGRQALLKGFASLTQATKELKVRQPESLRKACINLRNGAVLIEHLAKWKDDYESSEAPVIPVVGEFVRGMLAQLKEQGSLSPEILQLWSEEKFWDLQEHWAAARHDFFMSRPQKDKFVTRLDSLMLNLRDLHQLESPVQEQLLVTLESHYAAQVGLGFDLEKLQQYPSPWLVDLIVAVLSNGVPRFKIEDAVQQLRGTEYGELADLMARYLSEDDRDYLLDALALIERECEEREIAAASQ